MLLAPLALNGWRRSRSESTNHDVSHRPSSIVHRRSFETSPGPPRGSWFVGCQLVVARDRTLPALHPRAAPAAMVAVYVYR